MQPIVEYRGFVIASPDLSGRGDPSSLPSPIPDKSGLPRRYAPRNDREKKTENIIHVPHGALFSLKVRQASSPCSICLEFSSFPYYALKNYPEKFHAPEHSTETDERRGEAASH